MATKTDNEQRMEQIIKDLEGQVEANRFMDYEGPDRVVHFQEYLEIRKAYKPTIFQCPFDNFNEKLGGLAGGEVTVITGKTGEGKTLFAESLVRGMIGRNPDLKVCIFSYEVQPDALLAKYKDLPTLPMFLPLELKHMDINWLRDRVWEANFKHGCKVFLFDHLHFLIDMATKQNMSLNIGMFMRELKQKIALALDVSPILIAHQKGVARGEEPSLEDIRDSTFIAQEADNVIIVWRREDFTDEELGKMDEVMQMKIRARKEHFAPPQDKYADKFAMVQIAKARRSGAFRWKKLFQKVGDYLEEV